MKNLIASFVLGPDFFRHAMSIVRLLFDKRPLGLANYYYYTTTTILYYTTAGATNRKKSEEEEEHMSFSYSITRQNATIFTCLLLSSLPRIKSSPPRVMRATKKNHL